MLEKNCRICSVKQQRSATSWLSVAVPYRYPTPEMGNKAATLATACYKCDLPKVRSVVAAGANVNVEGDTPVGQCTPLEAAVYNDECYDIVRLLLAHGAVPDSNAMYNPVCYRSPYILQTLIDAGGDVNWQYHGEPLLFHAVGKYTADRNDPQGRVRVLLAEPSLDLTVTFDGKTPEQWAEEHGKLVLGRMVAEEVGDMVAIAPIWIAVVCHLGQVPFRA